MTRAAARRTRARSSRSADATEKRVWTLGYEGRGLADVLDALAGDGLRRLVDVRENPWSWKPGFSGPALAKALAERRIEYVHIVDLGCPAALRRALRKGGSRRAYEAGYRAHLHGQGPALRRLERLAETAPSALLCMERQVQDCHRRFLAERLARRGWTVVHL